MNFITKLFKKKKGNGPTRSELIENHVCPNCWGYQKYDDRFISEYDRANSNIGNDKSNRKAFIQQFVETHVTGIRLMSDSDKLSCPKCNKRIK